MIAAPSAKAVPAQDYYEATVPNTFDLAERADLVINAMTSVIKTDLDGEFIWCIHISPLKNVNYAPMKKSYAMCLCAWLIGEELGIRDSNPD